MTSVIGVYHAQSLTGKGNTQLCVSVSDPMTFLIGDVYLDGQLVMQTSDQVAQIPLTGFEEGEDFEFVVNFKQIG